MITIDTLPIVIWYCLCHRLVLLKQSCMLDSLLLVHFSRKLRYKTVETN